MTTLIEEYARKNADSIAIDCHQRTFHASKARALLSSLSSRALSAPTSDILTPEQGLRATDDTISALSDMLASSVHISAPSSLHRDIYHADLRAILSSYITTGELQPTLANLQHSDEILPLLYLDALPFVQSMATLIEEDGSVVSGRCWIEMANLQVSSPFPLRACMISR
jgi:hypothetical protein